MSSFQAYPTQPTPLQGNNAVQSAGWSAGNPPPTTPYMLQPSVLPSPEKKSQLPVTKPAGGILDAVQNHRVEVIKKMLEENPKLANEKGFIGLTPLHKAALRGDAEIIRTLLRFKADPNATNEFEETPLHYACKRGNIVNVKILLVNGGNVKAEDKAGKGVMHHAAHGGNVTCLHYLIEVWGMSTHVRDRNLNTPLHVVCSHGHTDALKYLLRKERSDMFAVDFAGNNSLHIAASAGHGWTCWKLLEDGGLSMLQVRNKGGHRPVDLASQGKEFKYKEIARLLSFYTNAHPKTGSAHGPVLAWYFLLALPICAYPLVLLVAQLVDMKGPVVTVGIVAVAIMVYQQSHRIYHLCRWPNPVHCGLFAAGLGHTLICYFCNILYYIYLERPVLAIGSVALSCVFVYMYIVLLTRDPGVHTEYAMKADGSRYLTIMDIASEQVRLEGFCSDCEIIPPAYAYHCKLCERCFSNMDHHCLFLYRCIAGNNHRLFVAFISLCLTGMFLFIYMTYLYLSHLYEGKYLNTELVWHLYNTHPWLWTMGVANAASSVWGVVLLRFQLKIVAKGHTTVYQPNKGKTALSGAQMVRNILHFMRGRPPYAIDSATYTRVEI